MPHDQDLQLQYNNAEFHADAHPFLTTKWAVLPAEMQNTNAVCLAADVAAHQAALVPSTPQKNCRACSFLRICRHLKCCETSLQQAAYYRTHTCCVYVVVIALCTAV